MEENSNTVIHSGSGGVKEMVSIALPMVVSSACDTVMMFTDRLFLSKLGPEHMSASMGGGVSAFMVMSFFLGMLGYSTAVTAQFLGAGERNKCPQVTYQAVLISFAAYPLMLLMLPAGLSLFKISGLSGEQLVHQIPYFRILIFASVLGLIRSVFSGFFSGIGHTRIVMLASLSAMFFNMIFSYILIFGKFGFPAMGIKGAAAGSVAGTVVAIAMLCYTYLKYLQRERIKLSDVAKFDFGITSKIVKFGFPAGLEFFLVMGAFTALITIFQAKGLESASAVTIVFNWDHVAYIPLIGLEIGVTSIFGRYIGAGRPDIAHKALISGIKTGTVYSAIIALVFLAFPGFLTDVFRPAEYDPLFASVKDNAVFMIRTASAYVVVEAMIVVYAGALRGAGDTYMAMAITVGVTWFLTGLTYIALYVADMSIKTTWLILVVFFFILPILLLLRYRSGAWKNIKPI